MRFDNKTTKRVIKRWGLDELSSVKSGAQVPAKATILKISADNLRELLCAALRDKFPKPEDVEYGEVWVCDHNDTHVVFSGYDNKQYALPYVMSTEGLFIGDNPVQVIRQGEYVTTEGEQFFKSATDAYGVALLSATGFDETQSLALAKSLDASSDTPIDDQVAELAAQFGKAVTASVGGESHPATDFAYVPESDKPSTWKLPIFDASHVSAAVAALGEGYRGKKISIPASDRGKVVDVVRAAYQEYFPDKELPDVLKKSGDTDMSDKTPEQLQKELDAQVARVADLEVLAKMTDGEKAYMANLSDEKKKEWMTMSSEDRAKAMKTEKANDETFTMTDGQVIAKSQVGEAAFGFMKAQNDEFVKMQDREANREALELVKSICPNLPGTPEAMAGALRKCKDSLTSEQFETLEKALKAGDTVLKERTKAKAHDKPVGVEDAMKAYDDGIAKIMSDKKLSKTAAMSSQEGLKLAKVYEDAVKETA